MGKKRSPNTVAPKPEARRKAKSLPESTPVFRETGDANRGAFGKRSEVKDAHDRYANIEVSHLDKREKR